jgi:hypothetical protein
MSDTCTGEWCAATEHVIDELGTFFFPPVSRDGPMRAIQKK